MLLRYRVDLLNALLYFAKWHTRHVYRSFDPLNMSDIILTDVVCFLRILEKRNLIVCVSPYQCAKQLLDSFNCPIQISIRRKEVTDACSKRIAVAAAIGGYKCLSGIIVLGHFSAELKRASMIYNLATLLETVN